jgi:hypothetical protein
MRRFRLSVIAVLIVVVVGVLTPVALGGGWAVTTIDPIDQALVPGRTVEIGYTIRQHGERPVNLADTGIEIAENGQRPAFFPGSQEGVSGHYVATVTVPPAGAAWTVRQDWFGPQAIGDLVTGWSTATAAPVPRPAASPIGASQHGGGDTPWILLAITALASIALLAQLAWRRQRPAAPEV